MRVVIVRNPRTTGGSKQRLATWHRRGDALGLEMHEIEVDFDAMAALRSPGAVSGLLAGRLVPEALSWREREVRAELDRLAPDVVLLQTIRTYSDLIADGPWVTVLDFVDRLSVSYRQRAGASNPATAAALRLLAAFHQRAERTSSSLPIRRVTAGRSGAGALGIPWIPILAPPDLLGVDPPEAPEFDAVFFGSLNYPPNYEALRWFATADGVDRLRVLVTGSRPHHSVEPLCERMGWTFEPDYLDVASLGERAALAVVPLVSAAGIQIKVLEAAANGIPQVVTPMAMQGFDQAFPTERAEGAHDIAHLVASLSKDRGRREDLAIRAKHHVEANYQEAAWIEDVTRLFTSAR